jgi:hypothetical protein
VFLSEKKTTDKEGVGLQKSLEKVVNSQTLTFFFVALPPLKKIERFVNSSYKKKKHFFFSEVFLLISFFKKSEHEWLRLC